MKRLTFILVLIIFLLIFSYEKPIVTGQITEEQFCDGKIFHYTKGQFTCTEGCDAQKGCCGAPNEPCCTEENSDYTECKTGLTCINKICKDTEEEIPDKTTKEINCNNISCAILDEDSCLDKDNVYCCDWDLKNKLTETIQRGTGCTAQEESTTKNIPVCKNKPESLIKIW